MRWMFTFRRTRWSRGGTPGTRPAANGGVMHPTRGIRAGIVVALGTVSLSVTHAAHASTSVSFSVTAGALSISEPTTANLGTVASSPSGTTLSGHLGSTTITDSRGSLAGWTATITATTFSDGATPTPHTIAANKFKAYVNAGDGPTVSSGVAVPATTYTTAATALTLSTSAQTLVTATATGSNVVAYNPTIAVTVDSSVVSGTYTGTVTQTVS